MKPEHSAVRVGLHEGTTDRQYPNSPHEKTTATTFISERKRKLLLSNTRCLKLKMTATHQHSGTV
jgi:hypothetical protein